MNIELQDQLKKIFKDAFGESEFVMDKELASYKADTLDLVYLVGKIEDVFNIKIKNSVHKWKTLGDVCDTISSGGDA